jgi:hypothetical protein
MKNNTNSLNNHRMKQFFIVTATVLFTGLGFSSCQKIISGNGYVYDKSSRQAIAGAKVMVYLEHPSPETLQMQTETDNKGAYMAASMPYTCTGTCPDLVVSIVADGYQSEYVRNPNGDTTFLVKEP